MNYFTKGPSAAATSAPEDVLSTRSIGDEPDELQAALDTYAPDTKAEKQLVKKIDLFMVPTLWLMCVLAYVDRNNITTVGHSDATNNMITEKRRIDPLLKHIADYSMLISIFFIGYLVFEIPSNMILGRVPPSWYLPGLMIAWGALVAGMSQVTSYHGVLVFRLFLGVIESGFMPGVMYVMSCWYKKREIGKRFSIFFTALCIAGAISGLLSGAIISGLEGAHGMAGWRWLFLLEGVITIGVAVVCKFILMDYPATTARLTPEERQLAGVRILHDKKSTSVQSKTRIGPLKALKAALFDLRTYFFMALYFLDNGCATINYFTPTVVQNMGYAGVQAQWMTVPIWIVATVLMVIVSLSSDRSNNRNWHVTFGFVLAFVSGIVVVTVKDNVPTRYTFIAFYISGVYCAFPLILTWCSEELSLPAEKRAVGIAFVNAVGNLSAIYGSYMWPSSDAPDYERGFTAMVGMCGGAAIVAAVSPMLFRTIPIIKRQAQKDREVVHGVAVQQ